nr:LysR family transcriptional regulator [uncultured Noviherbaspirillum sp.]
MNIQHLRHFIALAATGSFSRAAEQLHLTQPALSRSVKGLEDELGSLLVDRIGKKIELTPFGVLVLERAHRIVMEVAELESSASQHVAGGFGSLRVGLGSGPGALLMTQFLTFIANHHSTGKATIARGATDLLLMQLRQRLLDVLVIDLRRISPAPDLSIETLPEMRAGFLARAGHPLCARKRPCTIKDLRKYPIASTPLSREVAHILVERYGPEGDPEQCVTLQCEDVGSLVKVVMQSDTVFLGIVAAAREEIAHGAMKEIEMAPPLASGARYAFVTLAGRTQPPAIDVFRNFAIDAMRD